MKTNNLIYVISEDVHYSNTPLLVCNELIVIDETGKKSSFEKLLGIMQERKQHADYEVAEVIETLENGSYDWEDFVPNEGDKINFSIIEKKAEEGNLAALGAMLSGVGHESNKYVTTLNKMITTKSKVETFSIDFKEVKMSDINFMRQMLERAEDNIRDCEREKILLEMTKDKETPQSVLDFIKSKKIDCITFSHESNKHDRQDCWIEYFIFESSVEGEDYAFSVNKGDIWNAGDFDFHTESFKDQEEFKDYLYADFEGKDNAFKWSKNEDKIVEEMYSTIQKYLGFAYAKGLFSKDY